MTYRYTVQSVDRKDGILLLTLVPKRQGHALSFEPGQYAAIGFRQGLRPTPMRCFSIVSSPTSESLQFAMKIEGNFTQAAATALHPGATVRIQGPFGDFTINPDYDRRVVMLASGIGITPFLSMLRDMSEKRIKPPVTLFYSNRSSRSIPFKAQLQNLTQRNSNLRLEFFSGDTTGKVTKRQLLELVSANDKHTTYFICGTANFTERTRAALSALGVHSSRIINESFTQATPVATNSGLSLRTLTYSLSAAVMLLVTAGIMLLDLSRNLPTLQAKSAASTQPTSTTPVAGNATGSGANTNTQSQPPSSTTSQSSSGSSNYTYYQPPVSSVS